MPFLKARRAWCCELPVRGSPTIVANEPLKLATSNPHPQKPSHVDPRPFSREASPSTLTPCPSVTAARAPHCVDGRERGQASSATGGPSRAVPPLLTGGGDTGDCNGECGGEVAAAGEAVGGPPAGLVATGVRRGAGEGARVTPTGVATEAALKGAPPSS